MNGRKGVRISLVLATFTGIALVGALIDRTSTSEFADEETRVDMSDGASRSVHQSFQQAVVMLHAKQYDHAVQSLHQVFALQPRMPEAHVNMGYALLGLGNYRAARDFFMSATELRPSQYNAYYGLAIVSEELGDLAAAVAAMKTFAHLAPADDRFQRKAQSAIWEWEGELVGKRH